MKLKIELIPQTAFYSNLRKNISQKNWAKLGDQVRANAKYKCEICGSDGKNQVFTTRGSIKGTLDCHEIWAYNEKNHTQTLKGFIALCHDCHMIKHIGLAKIHASKGLGNMDKLIEHFMKINKLKRSDFDKHYEESFEVWRNRSQFKWNTNLSKWKDLVILKPN